MLFAALFRPTATAPALEELIARRAQWQYPEGAQPVAEYWLQTPDPAVIMLIEADGVAPMMAIRAAWGTFFDITMIPAITAAEGLRLAGQMAQG